MKLIDKIGYDTLSLKVSSVFTAIFVTSFINTGILLLLTNANLSSYPILDLLPLRGQFPDIDMFWYIEIGPSLVQTMIITAIFPYVEFLIFWTLKKVN
mmetsp:Transcript_30189/g.46169  ORF Transcript_30189/g.46169 Transcript_30189/m.46169 type:complete len:98 (+) Transcript_30189:907-1200(+)